VPPLDPEPLDPDPLDPEPLLECAPLLLDPATPPGYGSGLALEQPAMDREATSEEARSEPTMRAFMARERLQRACARAL
jgi:hypothetical protein